MKFSFIEVLA